MDKVNTVCAKDATIPQLRQRLDVDQRVTSSDFLFLPSSFLLTAAMHFVSWIFGLLALAYPIQVSLLLTLCRMGC